MKFPIPSNETGRLAELKKMNLKVSLADDDLRHIVKIAALICETPVSLVTIVDKEEQWFACKIGTEVENLPRDITFCQHTIMSQQVLVVPDATLDPRFSQNPLVTGEPHVRFYAGFPLTTKTGYNLGSVCVLDVQPRDLDNKQIEALTLLAMQAITLIEAKSELYRANYELKAEQWLGEFKTSLATNDIGSVDELLRWSLGALGIEAAAFIPFEETKDASFVHNEGDDHKPGDLHSLREALKETKEPSLTEHENTSLKPHLEEYFDLPVGAFVASAIGSSANDRVGWVVMVDSEIKSTVLSEVEKKAYSLLVSQISLFLNSSHRSLSKAG